MADVHANLEALEAVLRDAKEQRCTQFAFLGDFVGYCADPRACLEIIRGLNAPCVKGNHDEYCAADLPLTGFSPRAARMVEWTRKQLGSEDREWLRSLPYVRAMEDFTIVHASLERPERWGYIFDKSAAAASLTHQTTQVCFFGHTHIAMAFIRDGTIRAGTYEKFWVEGDKHYLVNPGSVGQPRDGTARATYVVYDLEKRMIELRRVEYDIAAAQKKIREVG